jgi:signal transduction histidine kinase
MKKYSSSIFFLVILCSFLIAAGCTQGEPAKTPATQAGIAGSQKDAYISNETLVAFVDNAVAYAKTSGTDKALAEFNNRNGSFVKGELYIFAYGYNGTTLAHPVNPEAVGKPREGANAVFVREMGTAVRNGSGFYRYVYINPWDNNTLESKLGYGEQVAEDWWLGSGVYTGPVNISGKTPEPSPAVITAAVTTSP